MSHAERLKGELDRLYAQHGFLKPAHVVTWAQAHPRSALHQCFEWDDTAAAHRYRLWQARQVITEVEVIYPDGKKRQVYVSPIESRGETGYFALIDILSSKQRRQLLLEQVLAELTRVTEKYRDLEELCGIRIQIDRLKKRRKQQA